MGLRIGLEGKGLENVKGLSGGSLEGEVSFNVFLQAASESTDKASELFSYGFYKFGRQIADVSNDFSTILASQGGSLPASAVMYYGLNLMYSDKKDMADRIADTAGAEKEMAGKEADLFGKQKGKPGRPFDAKNTNEVAFGGVVKAGVTAEKGDSAAGANVEMAYQNTMNAQTLNKTGIHGEQEDQGFFEDYELGSKTEQIFKLQGSGSLKMFGTSFSTALTFEKGIIKKREDKIGNDSSWQFSKKENEFVLEVKNMSKDQAVISELSTQIAAMVSEFIQNHRKVDKKANESNLKATFKSLDKSAIVAQVSSSILDKSLDTLPGVEVVDSVQIKLKYVSEISKSTKLTLTIGKLNTKEADFKVVEGKMVRFTPISDPVDIKL